MKVLKAAIKAYLQVKHKYVKLRKRSQVLKNDRKAR